MASSYRTLNLDVLTVRNILVKSATNSNIPINTVLASDGRGGTSWRNPNILFASTLSTISSLTYELTYGLSTITYPGYGLSSLSSIVSYGLSSITGNSGPNTGVSSLSSIVSYGLSSLTGNSGPNTGVSSLSSIVSYGLSSLTGNSEPNNGVSSLSSIVSYGLSSLTGNSVPNTGVSSLSSIVSYGLSSLTGSSGPNTGVSSLSSIVSYGLSSVYFYALSLSNTTLLQTIQLGLSSIVLDNSNSINPGVSSLSSIVSYGLSSITGISETNPGVSSLSSIISYGLSTVAAQPHSGVSSLSSIVSYGLSTVAAQPHSGVSSLSSIVSYGLSTVARQPNSGVSSLSSIVSYGLSSFSFVSVPFNTLMYGSGQTTQFLTAPNNPSQNNNLNGNTFITYSYGNNTWVAGGLSNPSMPTCLKYSLDGMNWNNSIGPVLGGLDSGAIISIVSLVYTGTVFVGAANTTAAGRHRIIWSSNGINWNLQTQYEINQRVTSIGYNSNTPPTWGFTAAGDMYISSNILGATTPNVFSELSGGFNISAAKIQYDSNLWIAVGLNSNNTSFANVQFSGNGLNWSNASNVTLQSSSNILGSNSDGFATYGGTSIAYANRIWYVAGAGGTTSNPIYSSPNGRNYTAIRTSDTSNINIFYYLEYDNVSRFYALANIRNLQTYSGTYLIGSSNNCSNWTVISSNTRINRFQNGMAIGTIIPPLQTRSLFTNNIYSDTVNAAFLTGDGNAITNLNLTRVNEEIATNSANIATNTANIATNTANITNVQNFFTAYSCRLSQDSVVAGDSNQSSATSFSNSLILSNIFGFGTVTQPIVGGIYMVSLKFTRATRLGVISIFNSNTEPYIYISQNVSNLSPFNGALTLEYIQTTGINCNNHVAFYPVNTIFQSHQFTGVFTAFCNLPFNLYWTERNPNANYSINVNFRNIILQRIG
jgi:hypothetical protein